MILKKIVHYYPYVKPTKYLFFLSLQRVLKREQSKIQNGCVSQRRNECDKKNIYIYYIEQTNEKIRSSKWQKTIDTNGRG